MSAHGEFTSQIPAVDPMWQLFYPALKQYGSLTVRLVPRLPAVAETIGTNAHALLDRSTGTTYLRADLSEGQMRAALGHEMTHVQHPDACETEVEQRTAELFVPWSVAAAARTAAQQEDFARLLTVDRQLIVARRDLGLGQLGQQRRAS